LNFCANGAFIAAETLSLFWLVEERRVNIDEELNGKHFLGEKSRIYQQVFW
jgi:hypothetical protein